MIRQMQLLTVKGEQHRRFTVTAAIGQRDADSIFVVVAKNVGVEGAMMGGAERDAFVYVDLRPKQRRHGRALALHERLRKERMTLPLQSSPARNRRALGISHREPQILLTARG